MLKQHSNSSRKSLGFMTEHEIELWSSDAKLKARLHQKRMNISANYKRKSEIANEQEIKIAVNTSLNRLREKTKQQRSNSSSLSNYMNYLEVDINRKKQMIDVAKYKYYRMIQFRNRSVIEKQQLSRQRQRLVKRHQMTVSMKASRIKIQRNNSTNSSKIWKAKNQQQAVKIKDIKLANQKKIAQRKQMQVAQNKSLVEKQKKLSQKNRDYLNQLKEKKIIQGKKVHDMKLLRQFAKSQMQRRKNARLLMIYNQKVKQLQDKRVQNSKQLTQYQHYLGKCFDKHKAKSKQAFFMTN